MQNNSMRISLFFRKRDKYHRQAFEYVMRMGEDKSRYIINLILNDMQARIPDFVLENPYAPITPPDDENPSAAHLGVPRDSSHAAQFPDEFSDERQYPESDDDPVSDELDAAMDDFN